MWKQRERARCVARADLIEDLLSGMALSSEGAKAGLKRAKELRKG